MIKIIIPLRPITKKNNMKIIKFGNRYGLKQSDRYDQYEQDCAYFIPKIDSPIDYRVNVACKYYMPTNGKVDLTNLMNATHDILVKYGVLEDDNSKIVASVDGSEVLYDKHNARTEIYIEEK